MNICGVPERVLGRGVLLLVLLGGLGVHVRARESGPLRDKPRAEVLWAPGGRASAQNAHFSPDGGTLLFTLFHHGYNEGPAGLHLLDLAGGRIRVLLDEASQDSVNMNGSAWNPRTGRIVFSSDREGGGGIWLIRPEGGTPEKVRHHRGRHDDLEPTLSPDGRDICYEHDPAPDDEESLHEIWRVAVDGGGARRISGGESDGVDDRQPVWSPRGDRILFQRRRSGTDEWRLYTQTTRSGDLRRLTAGPEDTDGSWSWDGEWIVYSSPGPDLDHAQIFVVRAAGGEPRRITWSESANDCAPAWSPDGRWIAFERLPREDAPSRLMRIRVPEGVGIASGSREPDPSR